MAPVGGDSFIDESTLQMLDQKVDFTIIKDDVDRTTLR